MLRPAKSASGTPTAAPTATSHRASRSTIQRTIAAIRPERHPQAEFSHAAADAVGDRPVEPRGWPAASASAPKIDGQARDHPILDHARGRGDLPAARLRRSAGAVPRAPASRARSAPSAPGTPAVLTSMSLRTSSGLHIGEHVRHVRRRDLQIDVAGVFDDADDDAGVLADRVAVVPALPHRALAGEEAVRHRGVDERRMRARRRDPRRGSRGRRGCEAPSSRSTDR